MPVFKVWTHDRIRKKAIVASSYDELLKKGRQKFSFSADGPLTLVLEEDGTEIDDDEALLELSKSTLLLLRSDETWQSLAALQIPQFLNSTAVSSSERERPELSLVDASENPTYPSEWSFCATTLPPGEEEGEEEAEGSSLLQYPSSSLAPSQPPLPPFSDVIKQNLQGGHLSTSIWNRMIGEAATFYLNEFPNISRSNEYLKIGKSVLQEYPSIAREGEREWSAFTKCLSQRIRQKRCLSKKRAQLSVSPPEGEDDTPELSPFLGQRAETADDPSSGVSVSVPRGRLVEVPLPPFSVGVESHLLDGTASQVWHKIITEAASYYSAMPFAMGILAYRNIGMKMVQRYPSIARQGKHKWSLFTKCLSQRLRRIRWLSKREMPGMKPAPGRPTVGGRTPQVCPPLDASAVSTISLGCATGDFPEATPYPMSIDRHQALNDDNDGGLPPSEDGQDPPRSPSGHRSEIPLPKFSAAVRTHLLAGVMPAIWSQLIAEAAYYYVYEFPIRNSNAYQEIGQRLYQMYPAIAREGEHAWSYFTKRLSQRIRYLRWTLRKKRLGVASLLTSAGEEVTANNESSSHLPETTTSSSSAAADPGDSKPVWLWTNEDDDFPSPRPDRNPSLPPPPPPPLEEISERIVKVEPGAAQETIELPPSSWQRAWILPVPSGRLKLILEEIAGYEEGLPVTEDFKYFVDEAKLRGALHKIELFMAAVESIMGCRTEGPERIVPVIHYVENCTAFEWDTGQKTESIITVYEDVPYEGIGELYRSGRNPPRLVLYRRGGVLAGSFVAYDGDYVPCGNASVARAVVTLMAAYYAMGVHYPTAHSQLLGALQNHVLGDDDDAVAYRGPFSSNFDAFDAAVRRHLRDEH